MQLTNKTIMLPRSDGSVSPYTVQGNGSYPVSSDPLKSRKVYAAAHVVCNPLADQHVNDQSLIDWERTLQYRRYLWSLGLSVAEAMDTAQRGMGLDWETSKELIRQSISEAKAVGGEIACGAGTDQLTSYENLTLRDIEEAYLEQCDFIENHGGRVILMASRALAACAKGPDDYFQVYEKVLSHIKKPVILHWLGEVFDPHLLNYWGYKDQDAAMRVCLDIITSLSEKVDGIKLSLLDPKIEVTMRNLLPQGVRMYTGDDFHYHTLIRGDQDGYSHALLGIFDAIAPAASAAIRALDQQDLQRYDQIMEPTIALSRHIFKKPTYYYKTGIVFMAYLNGHQPHFRMVAGLESARSIIHLSELFQLADQANLILDPELATHRMKLALELSGIAQ